MNPAKRIMKELKDQGDELQVTEYGGYEPIWKLNYHSLTLKGDVERCPHCGKIIWADVQWDVQGAKK